MFKLRFHAAIARLTLDRPGARNAISMEAWRQLPPLWEEVAASEARLLVIEAKPGAAFCAGADLADFAAFERDSEARTAFRLAMRAACDGVRDLPLPTLAAIDGACFGAGVALAMACDVRLAGPSARFAITPAKLGISYPQEDIARLVALVGSGQASRLLLSAASIDAAEAQRIGLIEAFHEQGLSDAVAAFAEAVLANDRASLTTLKRGIALAASGRERDEEQDARFDDLLGTSELKRRLERFRARPRLS